MKPRIAENEHISAAWAESACGPGWSNTPVWVLVRTNGTNETRIVCLQPDEQTNTMRALYDVANSISNAMLREAKIAIHGRRRKSA